MFLVQGCVDLRYGIGLARSIADRRRRREPLVTPERRNNLTPLYTVLPRKSYVKPFGNVEQTGPRSKSCRACRPRLGAQTIKTPAGRKPTRRARAPSPQIEFPANLFLEWAKKTPPASIRSPPGIRRRGRSRWAKFQFSLAGRVVVASGLAKQTARGRRVHSCGYGLLVPAFAIGLVLTNSH